MKASIIITTYKRSTELARAIESALNQSVDSFEVIVIDDNGLGCSAQLESEILIQKYNQLPNFRYYPMLSNQGACEGRNQGIQLAQGKYIFFLDDDDEFKHNKVGKQIKFMESNPKLDGCLSAFERLSKDGKIIENKSNYPVVGDFANFALYGNFFTPMLCIKKSSLEQVGGFKNIDRFQDRYLMLHCLLLNQKFGIQNEHLYTLYEHDGIRITNSDLKKTINSSKSIYDLIQKNINFFNKKEKRILKYNNSRIIAVSHYINSSYFIKIKGSLYWFKMFFWEFKKFDLLKGFKSFNPFN